MLVERQITDQLTDKENFTFHFTQEDESRDQSVFRSGVGHFHQLEMLCLGKIYVLYPFLLLWPARGLVLRCLHLIVDCLDSLIRITLKSKEKHIVWDYVLL